MWHFLSHIELSIECALFKCHKHMVKWGFVFDGLRFPTWIWICT